MFDNSWKSQGNIRVLRHCGLLVLVFLIGTHQCQCSSSDQDGPKRNKESPQKDSEKKAPTKVISLGESISRSQKHFQDPERMEKPKKGWERALIEIKDLAVDFPKNTKPHTSRSGSFLSQWKLLLDQTSIVELVSDQTSDQTNSNFTTARAVTTPSSSKKVRFEGFLSWERLLQNWADDVQEYVDRIEAENANADYPLGTYGRPSLKSKVDEHSKASATTQEKTVEIAAEKVIGDEVAVKTPTKKKAAIALPVPTPAKDGEAVLPHTDIADKSKRIWVVTTAALPWMTGTAVNPLLRAAYMTEGRKEAGGGVTLMLPWLERRQDQEAVYGAHRVFETPEAQEEYVRTWLRDTAKLVEASEFLDIKWYTAWQSKVENSVYSMGDITALIPAEAVDICILEEPEHMNWYRAPGESWTGKFKHVVGIIHTNYFVYAQDQPAALIRAPAMRLLCSWMCRAHCHRVIKLSGTLGQFAPEKELVENVHGVRASFLETGIELRKRLQSPSIAADPVFSPNADDSVYFIGKMLWSKGLGSLMELLTYAEESAGIKLKVDMYGGGPHKDAASARAQALELNMPFHGPIDHAELAFSHKVFINPSTSEVLCTTVAEALAMGKFVIVPSHPSNDFFAQFPNCLSYTNKDEFVGDLYYALTHSPEPLTEEYSHALSWQAATERLEAAGSIPVKEAEEMAKALSSNDAGIEISLPPLIDDEEGRRLVSTTLRQSRARYRQFRSRLSQEVQQNNVLPAPLKQRMLNELNKRLDLDIDNVLETPQLRLKLSPAELDKQLLELYNRVTDGPGGDILRSIGGGQEVAMQNLYLRKRARREKVRNMTNQTSLAFGPFDALDEETDAEKRTASQWVKWALRRNLPKSITPLPQSAPGKQQHPPSEKNEDKSKMSMSVLTSLPTRKETSSVGAWQLAPVSNRFCPPRSRTSSFSLLI